MLLIMVIVFDTSSIKIEAAREVFAVAPNIEPEVLTALVIPIEPTPVYTEPPYTDRDIELLVKTVWGEARGCSQEEWRLVVWTVLQRVDADDWGDTVEDVVTAKYQFIGYRTGNPIDPVIYAVVIEELTEWAHGANPLTHELYAPTAPYYFFYGDGVNNWFRGVW